MPSTTFTDGVTRVAAAWLNPVNVVIHSLLGDGTNAPTTKSALRTNMGATTVGDALITTASAAAARTTLEIPFIRNYHQGFTLSTIGSSVTMTIGSGQCADSTNSVLIDLPASISKTVGSWAVGSNQGGLDTGAIANSTWYYFYVIRRPDTGVTDVVFSLSPTSPTLPTNYTQYRLLMAWRTNGSGQWASWVQTGDRVDYQEYFSVLSGTTTPSRTTRTATLPNSVVLAYVTGEFAGTGVNDSLVFTDPAQTDIVPSFTGLGHVKAIAAGRWAGAVVPFRTSGGQIGERSVSGLLGGYGVVGFDFSPAKGR